MFKKIGVNQWRDHSTYTVADVAEEDVGLVFLLIPANLMAADRVNRDCLRMILEVSF